MYGKHRTPWLALALGNPTHFRAREYATYWIKENADAPAEVLALVGQAEQALERAASAAELADSLLREAIDKAAPWQRARQQGGEG